MTEHRLGPDRQARLHRLRDQLTGSAFSADTEATVRRHVAAVQADIDRWQLKEGQLVIIDEASLAGTLTLDELIEAATGAGAKFLLVGDPAQLNAIDAGGMFATLVADRQRGAPELTSVHRFRAQWERAASVALRNGDPGSLDSYRDHGRIHEGTRDEALDALYTAWRSDIRAGRSSLMIASDTATVGELNRRARADRVVAGEVTPGGAALGDGGVVGVGDRIVTRHNERSLGSEGRWVRNGDCWTVAGVGLDGALTVRHTTGGQAVLLPPGYVAEHVELAYAVTAHRCQGRTVDTAHTFASVRSTRETLYVSATRGRSGNHIYVDTTSDPDPDTGHDDGSATASSRDVLEAVLGNSGADISAHETIRRTQDRTDSIATITAEYQTIASTAADQRYRSILARSGLTPSQVASVIGGNAYPALRTESADAEQRGLNLDRMLTTLVKSRTIITADDPAAVLHQRVSRAVQAFQMRSTSQDDPVAGLVTRASHQGDEDTARALAEREVSIERRADILAEGAIADRMAWVRQLGRPPSQPTDRQEWLRNVATVAAYRDRWSIHSPTKPFGDRPTQSMGADQARQLRQAIAAARRARSDYWKGQEPAALRLAAPTSPRQPQEGVDL